MANPAFRREVPQLLCELTAELGENGVRVLGSWAFPTAGVLRVSADLTVWCYGCLLRWQHDGDQVTWPAADAYGAARRIAELVKGTAPEELPAVVVSTWFIPAGDDRSLLRD
jgi:hypothetical protein